MSDIIRVQLDVSDIIESLTNHLWVSIDQGLLSTVNDFKRLLRSKFQLFDERNINLYVKKCYLPDNETVLILRDEDVIRVVYEEQPSFCVYNGKASGDSIDGKNKTPENFFNLKRKHGEENGKAGCHLLCSPCLDSGDTCSSNKTVHLSGNKQQEPLPDDETCTLENEARKHKVKRKKSKHSKKDRDVPMDFVNALDEVNCDVSENIVDIVQDKSDDTFERKKKKCRLHLSFEETRITTEQQEICEDYSLASSHCKDNEEETSEEPVKLDSQAPSKEYNLTDRMEESIEFNFQALPNGGNHEIADEKQRESDTELNSQSPSKTNNVSLENNPPKRKRKRKRHRKKNSSIISSESLTTSTCSQNVAISTPKLNIGPQFYPCVRNPSITVAAPTHIFYEGLCANVATSTCEQNGNTSKTINLFQEPNSNMSENSNCMQEPDTDVSKTINCVQEPDTNVPKATNHVKDPNANFENCVLEFLAQVSMNSDSTPKKWNEKAQSVSIEQRKLRKPYSDYPPLKTFPCIGNIIAYKILELSSSYCPEVSDYKEGRVVGIHSNDLEIELLNEEVKVRDGKFENIYSCEIPEPQILKMVTVNWTALIEPKLIDRNE